MCVWNEKKHPGQGWAQQSREVRVGNFITFLEKENMVGSLKQSVREECIQIVLMATSEVRLLWKSLFMEVGKNLCSDKIEVWVSIFPLPSPSFPFSLLKLHWPQGWWLSWWEHPNQKSLTVESRPWLFNRGGFFWEGHRFFPSPWVIDSTRSSYCTKHFQKWFMLMACLRGLMLNRSYN